MSSTHNNRESLILGALPDAKQSRRDHPSRPQLATRTNSLKLNRAPLAPPAVRALNELVPILPQPLALPLALIRVIERREPQPTAADKAGERGEILMRQ